MNRLFLIRILVVVACGWSVNSVNGQLFPNLGGQRAGVSALTFLKLDVSPRAAAMAGAQLSERGDAYALHWNPAGMAELTRTSLAVANNFWAAGINHGFVGVSVPRGKWGTFGLSAVSLYAGDIERRTEFQPNGTGEYFSAANTAVGLSYARTLTQWFSYGATIKYVNELLDRFASHTAVADIGFMYRTDYKDIRFAVCFQSFGVNNRTVGSRPASPVQSINQEIASYPPPTVFMMGLSLTPYNDTTNIVRACFQVNHPNDNAANIRIGAEYSYDSLLFFRAGFKINVKDQPYPTFGVGFKTRIFKNPIFIDYAAEPMPTLGLRQRIGLSMYINRDKRTDNFNQPEQQPN